MLVTFFSVRPATGTVIAEPEDIVAIELLEKQLRATAGPAHVFVGVVSLRDIAKWLKAHPRKPGDHVQLVGHGSPGRLALGYFWTRTYRDAKGNVFALDSNLVYHGILRAGIPAGVTVDLIGCAVGEDRLGPIHADGPTLLFDLARMWGTRVRAPVGVIGADAFDATGRLTPAASATLVVAEARAVSARPTLPEPILGDHVTLAPIAEVLRAPLFDGEDSPSARDMLAPRLRTLGPLDARSLARPPVLAHPELVLRLADGRTATVLANASIIRVYDDETDGGRVTYYALATDALRATLRATVPELPTAASPEP